MGNLSLMFPFRNRRRMPTFVRASSAYNSNGALVDANTPRYEQGRFGQAVMVEDGTTNILTANQASVKTDTAGFSPNAVGTALTRVTDSFWHGSASLRSVCDGVRTSQGFNTAQTKTTVAANTPCTASLMLRGSGNATLSLSENRTTDATVWTSRTSASNNLWRSVCWSAERGLFVAVAWTGTGNRVMTSPASTRTSVGVALTDTWTQYAVSQELGAAAESVHLTVGTSVAQNTTFWTDGLQVEQKPFATSWHLPGTTRAEEIISAPLANIVFPTQGEVGFWWNPRTPVSAIISQAASPILLQIGTHHSNASLTLWAWHNAGAEPHLMLYVRGQSAGGWSLVQIVRASGSGWYQQDLFNNYAVTWSGGHNFRVYRNGTLVGGPYTIADPVTAWHGTQIWFGNDGAGQGTPGALIDDIRISRTERTGAEILAGFNSGAPLPVDSDTTYKANFDGNLGVN